MAALYAELASLLPGLRSRVRLLSLSLRRAGKKIVEAAAKQVKVLEDTVAVLEAYRAVQVGGAAAAEEVSVSYRETVCFAARLPAARRPRRADARAGGVRPARRGGPGSDAGGRRPRGHGHGHRGRRGAGHRGDDQGGHRQHRVTP
ncbi:hypothetical protein OsJ_36367 [Oryza sativa Japonica Group]|uniref:Uncharacterized protein n=1 Tax=Oryza sativa subsp. japonica TaxID=39947 RepID=B9GDJ0_ORYSJ|nr:hypothetical protein OsJ_36367 [Oryza sativa Japonica Group]